MAKPAGKDPKTNEREAADVGIIMGSKSDWATMSVRIGDARQAGRAL